MTPKLTRLNLDDFTQLNEKFIKARRDYEALLESSMSHPPQHNYQQYPLRPAPQGHQGYAGGGYVPGQAHPETYYNQGPPSGMIARIFAGFLFVLLFRLLLMFSPSS